MEKSKLQYTTKAANQFSEVGLPNIIQFCQILNCRKSDFRKLIVLLLGSFWILILLPLEANAAIVRQSINTGLVGYWSFNEGTTTTALDYSGKGNKGTLRNGPVWTSGKLGKALSFDGVNDLVDIPHTSQLEITGDVSISVWIFWRTTGTNNKNVFTKGECFGTVCPYRVEVNRTNQRVTFIHNDGTAASQDALTGVTNSAPPNTWIHVVVTRNTSNTTRSIYINGVLSTGPTAYTKSPTASNDPVRIGNDDLDTDQPFDGLLDEVRIYDRALTSQEARAIYNSGAVTHKNPTISGLVGYWSFNEGTTTTALDYSGNNNKGTLINGPVWTSGKLGKALNFDGEDDTVIVATSSILNFGANQPFTATFWLKGNDSSQSQHFIYKRVEAAGGLGYEVRFTTGPSKFFLRIDEGTANVDTALTNPTLPFDGRWHHIAAGRDTTKHFIYLDGVLDATSADSTLADLSNTTNLGIGSKSILGVNAAINGAMDEVRIYNRALTAQEVSALFNAGAVTHKNPTTSGLVGYWSFNEGTTTTALDYSGKGNKGTLRSGPVWTSGKLGKALSFDGSNDFVDAGNSASLFSDVFTASAWFFPKVYGNDFARILQQGLNNGGFGLEFDSSSGSGDKTVYGVIWNGVTSTRVTPSSQTSLNIWHHVALVYNGVSDAATIYLDGVAVGTASSAMTSPTLSFRIGQPNVAGEVALNGLIDEVRIYNRALTAQEVRALYESR